jgi:hypothetical protein
MAKSERKERADWKFERIRKLICLDWLGRVTSGEGQVVNLLRLAGERAEWKFGEVQVVNLLRLAGERAEWKFGEVQEFFIC